MEVASRIRGKNSRNDVVACSVWENRMRFDEGKGGINVYSEKEETPEVETDEKISTILSGEKTNQVQVEKNLEMGSKSNLGVAVGCGVMSGKRKTWKSESNFEGNPTQISTKRSEFSKNMNEQCKELSTVSSGDNAMKKSPIQNKKYSSSVSAKVKSGLLLQKQKGVFGELSGGNEGNGIQLRKVKSEANKEGNEKMSVLRKVKSMSPNGNLRNSLQLVKAKSSSKELDENSKNSDVIEENKAVDAVLDESKKYLEENEDGNEKNSELRKLKSVSLDGNLRNSLQMLKTKSEKCKKDFEENKVVVVVLDHESKKKNLEGSFEGIGEKSRSEENCEERDITSNMESQEKLNLETEDFKILEEDFDEEIQKGSVDDVKEISVADQIIKPKKIVIIEENKVHISNNEERPVPISPTSDESQRNIPRQHRKLESLVELIMWRDASKSALIFGIGTFVIISSSYTQELNISFISVISYLGLVYLAVIFLFRSLIHRGANDMGESSEYIVGEEEAVWVLKLILPYINECLLKIRALFSGDPATTMKMAVLLFILARCGTSITIWKMSKLSFFGVFIVPKVCSSYSTQLTAYGTFWIRRFGDAWETCTHKKAVAFAIFSIIWNLSSVSTRIWTVFMLYVGFRYYQQKQMKEGWVIEEEITEADDYWQRQIGRKSTCNGIKKAIRSP